MRRLTQANAARRSSPRPLLLAGLVAAGCLIPAAAHAELHLAFGTRWQPLRYTKAIFPNASGMDRITLDNSGFQSTSLDPYLALFFAQKYGAVLSLDIGYGKNNASTATNSTMGSSTIKSENGYFQFGFSLGFKWYITAPRAGKVSPYLYADFFKYFASVMTDQMITPDQASFQATAASPIGASFAFGAEYFVSPAFSVGSEVLGLRVASAGGDWNIPNGTGSSTTRSLSYTYLTFYTGISLNYRFAVSAKVSAGEDEQEGEEKEAPKPVKRKKVKPPEGEGEGTAPPPPPPTPESVD